MNTLIVSNVIINLNNILFCVVGLGDKEAEEDLRKELAALSLVGSYKHIVGMMGASYTEGDSTIVVAPI